MEKNGKLLIALLCSASFLTLSAAARAQEGTDTPETVVVTGSRVISDIANSPTPLTTVTIGTLQATTPSNVPDALNKLPVFQGSSTPTNTNNASSNNSGNVLSLRSFGAQRTLVLFDGHRVTPSNSSGTVDVDTLPQMLMQRVDVVTGGASAVYGSDAVTGVVNFILDKHFNGVKIDVNGGISTYADAGSYKAALAGGTDLLGGKAHIEASIEHFHKDGVKNSARPEGPQDWLQTGKGTPANPYAATEYSTRSDFSFGGKISCTGCAANGMQFITDGVVGPFAPGTLTGTTGINSGGDGSPSTVGSLSSTLTTDDAFGRFSYNLGETTSAYVQVTAAQSYDQDTFQNNYIQTGSVPNTFYTNNPYLPSAAQALLANPSKTFKIAKYINNQGPNAGFQTTGINRNMSVTTGIDGTLFDKYDWDVFYTHGQNRQKVDDASNQNNQKMYAAEDAVLNSSNQVVCYASLSSDPAIAAEYQSCAPMNPFGPTALTSGQYKYILQDTNFIMTNVLDNVGASVAGSIFDDWAGPVKAALSGEMRWMTFAVDSNATPSQTIDCTGLRLCNASTALFQGNIAADQPEVSENVWEFAGEVNVPLLKDLPLVQSLNVDVAGRYTDYSTSGATQTWKIGLNYHVNDDILFRATTSVDIRAPTLNDLFSPQQLTHAAFTDILTGANGTLLTARQGNPNLVPEVARTYTAGVVLTPSFISGLTFSLDYYNISLDNVIGSISANSSTIQKLCNDSGGTSPYCALYVRPFPVTNTSPANYPTEILSESLNTAFNSIEGWDLETDYGFEMADVAAALPGAVTLRLLANYQPVSESQSFVGAPLSAGGGSKTHITGFMRYSLGNWSFSFENRWISGHSRVGLAGQTYVNPHVNSVDYLDVNIDRKIHIGDEVLSPYLSIQNIGNTRPPIAPSQADSPGLYFMGNEGNGVGYDEIGRYFTVGIRASL